MAENTYRHVLLCTGRDTSERHSSRTRSLAESLLPSGLTRSALVGGVVAVGLSMLPGYDQQVPGLAHRGRAHTVWFALLVGLALAVVGGPAGRESGLLSVLGLTTFGSLVGVVTIGSHILADSLTPAGSSSRQQTPSSPYAVSPNPPGQQRTVTAPLRKESLETQQEFRE